MHGHDCGAHGTRHSEGEMETQKGYTGRRCSEERSFVNTLACIPDKSKWINNVVILPYLDRREAGLLTRFWRQTFQGQPLSSLTALFQALHQIQLDIHIPGKHIYNIFFESYFLLSLFSPHFVPQKQVLLLLCLTRFLKVCMREKCIS